MLVLKLLFWFAVLCLLTGISVIPAMVIGLIAVMVGGMVDALLGRGRGRRNGGGM